MHITAHWQAINIHSIRYYVSTSKLREQAVSRATYRFIFKTSNITTNIYILLLFCFKLRLIRVNKLDSSDPRGSLQALYNCVSKGSYYFATVLHYFALFCNCTIYCTNNFTIMLIALFCTILLKLFCNYFALLQTLTLRRPYHPTDKTCSL